MTPAELLGAARGLIENGATAAPGVWPRAVALLARQALEGEVRRVLRDRAAGAETASFRIQFLCLPEVLGDPALARRCSFAWWELTRATHVQAYELPPTADELQRWCDVVEELLEAPRGKD